MQVPAPTFCPMCRVQRRFAWRNEQYLYKNIYNDTKKEGFAFVPSNSPVKVVTEKFWYSDEWDPLKYGQEYDFSKPFFEQYKELLSNIPWSSRWVINTINSEYSINTNDVKNSYLIMSSSYVENSSYGIWLSHVEDSIDLYSVAKSSLCYESAFPLNKSR